MKRAIAKPLNMLQKKLILSILTLVSFFILSAQPTISSFSPTSGPIGTPVTINGSNFSTTPANNIVFFGSVKANISTATSTSLTVTVPAGADFRPFTVTTGGLTATSAKAFIVTFSNGGTISSNSYSSKIDFNTDLRPNGIVAVDLDGDGKPDLATPNNYSIAGQPASVSVLRNTSNASGINFAAFQNLNTGPVTYTLASGDIDGDGKPDLVAHSIAELNISVFRNTSTIGNISFAPKVDYSTVGGVHGINITDLDGDGKSDIVAANNLNGLISVYRNTGSPGNISFAPKVDFTTLVGPKSIALGDFDNDGKRDMAVTSDLINGFSIFRNTGSPGNIAFSARADIATGSGNICFGISSGDLDDDAKEDLVIVINNNNTSSAQLYRNTSTTGNITFNLAATIAGGSSATSYHAALGDVNGDGKPDIALSVDGIVSGQNKVYQNNSTTGVISFGTPNSFPSFSPYAEAICDLDADGRPELISTFFIGSNISVFKNRCGFPNIIFINPTSAAAGATVTINGSNFTSATSVTFGGVPATSFIVVNATTITAVVGAGATGDVVVTTPIGTGSVSGFTFIAPPVVSSFNPTTAGTGMTVTITGSHFTSATGVSFGGVSAASFTVVNSTTITAVVGAGASGNVNVTNTFGTGSLAGFTYQPPPSIISFTPVSGSQGTSITITGANFNNVQSVTVGGLAVSSYIVNSPTSITAVVGEGATGSIKVTTLWGVAISSSIYSYPPPAIISFSPLSGPVGTTITITGSNFRSDPGSNYVYFGATRATVISASTTSLTVTVPAGATYQPISVSVNNHSAMSKQFFITTFTSSNTAFTNRSFGWSGGFAVEAGPGRTVLADIDGDGKSDIITGNFTLRTITIIRNSSTSGIISFAAPVQLASGLGTQIMVATADMNGDGKLDIAFTGNQSLVSVLLNTSTPGSISFSPRVDFTALEVCRGIALGDFDGDAKTDIAVSTGSIFTSGHFISVFRNTGFNGEINFASRIDISVTGTPHDVRATDMDNDNKTDLVIGAETYMGVMKSIGTPGTISFNTLQSFGSGYYVQVVTGDVDGDNLIDVLSVNNPNANISAFRNTSTTGVVSMASPVTISGYASTLFLRLGQLDGDGKPDLIIVPTNDRKVYVKRNESTPGTIAFSGTAEFAPQLTDNWVGDAAIGDLEGDNKTDFAVTNTTDNKVSIFRNRSGFPTITSFTPSSAGPGGVVQINGTDFTGVNAVRFGNVPVTSFSVLNSTTITATVGTGSSGFVFTGSPVGSDSIAGFTFIGIPSINSFAPISAAAGTTITITGTNLTGTSLVSFGGTAASSFTVVNATTITAVVGAGASGSVSITTPGGTATRAGFTFIPGPVITSFTPTNATTGATVTITGTNFSGVTAVSFGGAAATSFTVLNATTITAVVGAGASGSISITGPGGTTTLGTFTFNGVTAVPNIPNNTIEFVIIPNPVDDIALVKHPSANKKTEIRFVDISGRVVKVIYPVINTKQTQVDLKELSQSIYNMIWSDGMRSISRTFMIK
jgi:hypothetical protein